MLTIIISLLSLPVPNYISLLEKKYISPSPSPPPPPPKIWVWCGKGGGGKGETTFNIFC